VKRQNPSELPPGAPTSRTLARGPDWGVWEVTCRLGPQHRRFEERHDWVSIAAVVEGTFQYRSSHGSALLYPGSFLLGNAGSCFECGHDHGTGDRCIAFGFAPAYFEEIAASVARSHRFRFRAAMLPALREMAAPIVAIESRAKGCDSFAFDEAAVNVAEMVIATLSGRPAATAGAAPRDERRIGEVLGFIDRHSAEPLELAGLAQRACMSKYHFLRTFRRVAGVTPYQYLLGTRMRRAAIALRTTKAPVAHIAFDAGFGDLSTFTTQFRRRFAATPSAYRSDATPA
jgi:AraC-like DNA-binding protein